MHREAWKLHLAVFWIALLAPYAARAGVDTWTYSGVPAGPIYRLVAGGADDPWYAMSANGVWRTRTRGTSWQHVLAGSSTPLRAVLEGDPQDPELVVAGLEEGYFVSENAGATWRGPLLAPNGGTLDDVVIHPAEPGVWTALERVPFRDETTVPGGPGRMVARDVYTTQTSRVLVSRDRGRTWIEVNPYVYGAELVPDPRAAGAFWIVEGFIFGRSEDGGVSWSYADGGTSIYPGASRLVAGSGGDVPIFLSARGVLVVLDPATSAWRFVLIEHRPIIYGAMIDPGDRGTMVLATDRGLLAAEVDDLLAAGYERAAAPTSVEGISPGVFYDLIAGSGSAGIVAAGAESLVLRTADGTWTTRPGEGLRGVPAPTFAFLPGATSPMLVGGPDGVDRSDDGGVTWSRLPGSPLQVESLAVSGGDRLYAGTAPGRDYGTVGGRFARLPGGDWERRNSGYGTLIGDPSDPETLVELGPSLRRSRDGGFTWEYPFGNGSVGALALSPSEPQHWYTGYRQVHHSTNGGNTFVPEASPEGYLAALAVDPEDPFHVIAVQAQTGGAIISERRGLFGSWTKRLEVVGGRECFRESASFDPGGSGRVAVRICATLRTSLDGGVTWSAAKTLPPQDYELGVASLAVDPRDPRLLWMGTDRGLFRRLDVGAEPLLLGGGRFEVRVAWEGPGGGRGVGRPMPLTDDTGYFWFFAPDNVELMVKVLDGRGVNGRFWVFYASLTNVAFEMTVSDRLSGEAVTYHNAPGTLASRGDTEALGPAPPRASAAGSEARIAHAGLEVATPDPRDAVSGGLGETLPLHDGRFEATVEWEDFRGNAGTGTPQAITGDTGYFWFFRPDNVELVVKVLDGRPVNGRWWVFAGALSNVAYRLTVTDTVSDETVVYDNPSGTFASFGDTAAFPRP